MNLLKTALLLAGLTALFGGVGWMLGGEAGMATALLMAAVTNIGAYWFSDSIVLRMYGARPVPSGALYDMVAVLAGRAGIPTPRVYVIESAQPNAFATGRNPSHGAVAVSRGLMQILDERELAGVIAHELAHIKHRDTLTMTITATLAGAIATLVNFGYFFGGRRYDDDGRSRGNPLLSMLVLMLAPMAAMLVQLAISRAREYDADAGGAAICGDPRALASALSKLEQAARGIINPAAENHPATAHLFIVNPLNGLRFDSLFATHPKTADRIEALMALADRLTSRDSQTQSMTPSRGQAH
jgi:heat shock protein HtpX